ncbi:MAG: Rpn family recombination-promoting nuclease/putative transposase [Treponema sp.]|nr:Rpn family recombination-promoting nuclease/putative transposase [Treponema sp.]
MSQLNNQSPTNEANLTPEEKWKRATIANNFIFYKVMHNNPDVCKELLEILLQIQIDHIEMSTEEEILIDYGKKGIRMDVYAVGATRAFNLEMQTTDTGELPERSRYYQGVLDIQELNSGENYKSLKDSYIIFICLTDIFHKGLAKYTFENLCIQNPEIKLNDRTYKYFFIAENYDKILDERQKAFLKLVTSNESSDDFADRISKLVEDAKHNTLWRKQFMEFERYLAYSFRDGEAKGKQEKAEEDATAFLKEGDSPEKISRCTGLPLERVLELQEQIKVSEALTPTP